VAAQPHNYNSSPHEQVFFSLFVKCNRWE
jgi:hypothetical protein